MKNLILKWAIDNNVAFMNEKLDNLVGIIETHCLFEDVTEGNDGEFVASACNPTFFKKENENKVVYDLFIDNLHIHMSKGGKETVYSIRVKKNEEDWNFVKLEDGTWDVSHPIVETFEIYVWYDVPVLDITRSVGYLYKHGSWDRYFRKTFNLLEKKINEMTTAYQFDADYKKKRKN